MNELAAIQATLASIKAATDIAKILKDSAMSLRDAEAKFRVAELISSLADAKVELASVQDTLQQQEREIRELKEKQAFAGNMQYESPYYWHVEGEKRDGPFCQPCWDQKRLAIRLYSNTPGYWSCQVCNNNVMDKNYRSGSSARSGGSWISR
jgi:hypothetical protein